MWPSINSPLSPQESSHIFMDLDWLNVLLLCSYTVFHVFFCICGAVFGGATQNHIFSQWWDQKPPRSFSSRIKRFSSSTLAASAIPHVPWCPSLFSLFRSKLFRNLGLLKMGYLYRSTCCSNKSWTTLLVVNPGLINHGLFWGYHPNSDNMVLNGYLPNLAQPFRAYENSQAWHSALRLAGGHRVGQVSCAHQREVGFAQEIPGHWDTIVQAFHLPVLAKIGWTN